MQNARASNHDTLTPYGVQAFAARNLELIAAIENTLGALRADTQLIRAIHAGYKEIRVRLTAIDGPIDGDGRVAAILAKTSDACARIYRDYKRRRDEALADPLLTGDASIAGAYDGFIRALTTLHDEIEEQIDWIGDHDACFEPGNGKVYTNVNDLFKALSIDTE